MCQLLNFCIETVAAVVVATMKAMRWNIILTFLKMGQIC